MARRRAYGAVAPVLHRLALAVRLHRRELRRPILVRRVTIPAGLGLRIVLVADLHADPVFLPRSRVAQVVDLVNSIEDVDLVAMPGDFVGHDVTSIDFTAEELARIDAPVVATLGNHDHMEGAAYVTRALEAVGIDVLVDEARPLDGPHGAWVAGIDSVVARRPSRVDLDALVPSGAHCVVLGHEPWWATRHSQVLHLAGHTHHGQIRIPRLPPPYLPRYSRPYMEGLSTIDDGMGERRFVYTTAGIGSTTLPLRIGAPAEIVVIDA